MPTAVIRAWRGCAARTSRNGVRLRSENGGSGSQPSSVLSASGAGSARASAARCRGGAIAVSAANWTAPAVSAASAAGLASRGASDASLAMPRSIDHAGSPDRAYGADDLRFHL